MGRSDALNQRMREERREQILSAALRLFATRGLAATKITDIIAETGISQGLLYHYFPSKEALYVALVRKAFEGMDRAARALENMPLSPRDKIATAIAELLRLLETNGDFARYFMLTAQAAWSSATPDEAVALCRRHRRGPYESIARIMRAGQRDGSIRPHDPDELALVFWTTIKGLAMHRATVGRQFKAPDPRVLTTMFFTEADDR